MAEVHLEFGHSWQAEILTARPLILPSRHWTYPAAVEEVERGALEVMVTPAEGSVFLATCALGFRDPAVPSGVWSMPNADWMCAVCGGYAYAVNTRQPEEFQQIVWRPVLAVMPIVELGLMLFVGHHALVGWSSAGELWQSDRVSWEGVEVTGREGQLLHGMGWDLMTDRETPFTLDLETGRRVSR
jgi:hypothetical protein